MKTLVIAPHPDDELLGCGGTLLRRQAEGHETAWILVTEARGGGVGPDPTTREIEIASVRAGLGIPPERLVRLGHATTTLDTVPISELVGGLAAAISRIAPDEVLIPHSGDAHSDHRIVAEAAIAATKWFRQPSVMRILAYETLSETGLGSGPQFRPDVHIDISPWLDQKIELTRNYASEFGTFPFPRSEESVRSLAALRGSNSGFVAAEAFQVIVAREPLDGSGR